MAVLTRSRLVPALLLAACATAPAPVQPPPAVWRAVAPRVPEPALLELPAAGFAAAGGELLPAWTVAALPPAEVRIPFPANGITLTVAARRLLAGLLDEARSSAQITVHGYCDRKRIGNAKDAALMRASAVIEELVRLGIPARRLHLRYHTDRPEDVAIVTLEH